MREYAESDPSRPDDAPLTRNRVPCRVTMASRRLSQPPIADSVDAVALFEEGRTTFEGMFRLERLVAASQYRALFVARHAVLKRRVALRVHLDPHGEGRAWFERETELLARIDHPGIRPIHSAGYREGWAYRVSKWMEGESLEDAMVRGPRPLPDVLQIARDLASALDYAHSEGIVIRRIAPTALMLTRARRAIITDMRWANHLTDVASPEPADESRAFMAPETREGGAGEPGADVYTAGALLYYATTGREPALDPADIEPPRALRAACPRALERVMLHALRPRPETRYLTAAEMGADLLSEIGDFELQTSVEPAVDGSENPAAWERQLRRALGDQYELLSELGSGGFGRVYRVRDLSLEREVALKVLHPWLTTDPAVIERFRREARLAAQIRHPSIVDVHGIGGRAGLLWYTMAYVPGENLDQLVERAGPLPIDRARHLLEQSLSGLAHAHQLGLVHRDIKPANILIELPSWEAQITDFGLALAFEGMRTDGRSPSRSGTPEFAAPEQLLGEPVDVRADIYSLAVVAIFALTGRSPFGGGPVESIVARQAAGQLPDLRTARPGLPRRLRNVLTRAASRDPNDRYASAQAFREAVRTAGPLRERLIPSWLRTAFLAPTRAP